MAYRKRNRSGTHKRRPFVPGRMAGESLTDSTLNVVFHRISLLRRDEREGLMRAAEAAFDVFRRGMGDSVAWAYLADTINIAAALAEGVIASDHKGTFAEASAALSAVHERHSLRGSWTLRGPEIAALDLALFVHRVQLENCSRGELGTALQKVINRSRAALAGNAAPGARVYAAGHLSQVTTTPV